MQGKKRNKRNKTGQKKLEKNNMPVEKYPLSLSELEGMHGSSITSNNKDRALSHCSNCKIYLAGADMD